MLGPGCSLCAHSCGLTSAQGSTQCCWHLAEPRTCPSTGLGGQTPPSRCVLSITSTHLHCMRTCSQWHPLEFIPGALAVSGPAVHGHRQVQAEHSYLFYSREGWSGLCCCMAIEAQPGSARCCTSCCQNPKSLDFKSRSVSQCLFTAPLQHL